MKSTIRNFTTAFFAWFFSILLFFVYISINREENTAEGREYFVIVIVIACMSVCAAIGLISLLFLSLLSNIFNWSESKDYLLKIGLSITLYLPIYFVMKEISWLSTFWYWSLTSTLALITFDYKHLFIEHFSFGRQKLPSENFKSNLPW